jgi:hypothetical protein
MRRFLFLPIVLIQLFVFPLVHAERIYLDKKYRIGIYPDRWGNPSSFMDVTVKVRGPDYDDIRLGEIQYFVIEIIPQGHDSNPESGAKVPYFCSMYLALIVLDDIVDISYPKQEGYAVPGYSTKGHRGWTELKPLSKEEAGKYKDIEGLLRWIYKMTLGAIPYIGMFASDISDLTDVKIDTGETADKISNRLGAKDVIDFENKYDLIEFLTAPGCKNLVSARRFIFPMSFKGVEKEMEFGIILSCSFSMLNDPRWGYTSVGGLHDRFIGIKVREPLTREEEIINSVKFAFGLEKSLFKNERLIRSKKDVYNFYCRGFDEDIAKRLADYSWWEGYDRLRPTEACLSVPENVHILGIGQNTARVYYKNSGGYQNVWDSKKYSVVQLIRKKNRWIVYNSKGTNILPSRLR